MGFEFELGDLSDIDWHATEYIVDFTIGFDLENRERISMAIALIEDEEGGTDPFALTFGIMKTPIDGGAAEGPFFDHATCRTFVSKENAEAVMNLILVAVRKLVAEVEPQTVEMATYEEALPPPAMAKYYRITNCLGQCGFGMTSYQRDGTDQKDYWLFTK
jgi:hypothetical protein